MVPYSYFVEAYSAVYLRTSMMTISSERVKLRHAADALDTIDMFWSCCALQVFIMADFCVRQCSRKRVQQL